MRITPSLFLFESYRYLNTNLSPATFALTTYAGDQLKIIKFLGGEWQNTDLPVSWVDEVPEKGVADEEYYLYPIISEDAKTIIALSLVDGRFDLYRINGENDAFETLSQSCAGDSNYDWANPGFTTATLSQDNSRLYLGTDDGAVYAVPLGDSCPDWTSLSPLQLAASNSIISISRDNTEIIVHQTEGTISNLTDNGINLELRRAYDLPCNNPAASRRFADDYVLTVCREVQGAEDDEGKLDFFDLTRNFEDSKTYHAYNESTGQSISKYLDFSQEAGVSIEEDSLRLYQFERSSLGILNYWRIDDGSEGTLNNLLIKDFLD